jgi:hypothetical protein
MRVKKMYYPGDLSWMMKEMKYWLSIVLAALVTSCSSVSQGSGARVNKVKTAHFLPEAQLNTDEPALEFERYRRLYGAVTRKEIMARKGNYYTFLWKITDGDYVTPVKLVFEYYQANTGFQVKKMEVVITPTKGQQIQDFCVNGDAYVKDGRVSSWRFKVLRKDKELVSQQSYLWHS